MPNLKRGLSLFDATVIVVANAIGTGIFTTTGFIAQEVASPGLLILVWLIGGALALAGALSYAELGASMPLAGGEYLYLREAYGPLLAFLTGWTSFFIGFSGPIAASAVSAADYLSHFLPALSIKNLLFSADLLGLSLSLSYGHLLAILFVLGFSFIHYIGLKSGAVAQNFLTVVKVGTIVTIIALAAIAGNGNAAHFSPLISSEFSLTGVGVALVIVMFSYSGWNASAYIAGEIKNPSRNLPFSLIIGTVIITVLFVALNIMYIYALPVAEMQGQLEIGKLASTALFGNSVTNYFIAFLVISILGCMSAMILAGPRVYYAMAKDGLFFKSAARVSPRFQTPGTSIWMQAIWSCILIVSGTFNQLLTYTSFALLLFSAITAISVFVLRAKRPLLARPYKTWGYPVAPALFVISSLIICISTALERTSESLLGLLVVSAGIPVYLYWRRNSTASSYQTRSELEIEQPEKVADYGL